MFAPSDLSTAGEDSLRGKHAIWVEKRVSNAGSDRQKSCEVNGDAAPADDGWQAKR